MEASTGHRCKVQENSRDGTRAVEITVDKANLCMLCGKEPVSIVGVWATRNVAQSGRGGVKMETELDWVLEGGAGSLGEAPEQGHRGRGFPGARHVGRTSPQWRSREEYHACAGLPGRAAHQKGWMA